MFIGRVRLAYNIRGLVQAKLLRLEVLGRQAEMVMLAVS